jgi:hypothetical protein
VKVGIHVFAWIPKALGGFASVHPANPGLNMSTTRRSSQEDEIISPDIDIDTVDPEKPQSSSFTLKMVMELKSSHIGLTPAIRNLSQTIERQRQKLDKLDDLRIEFASHKATLDRACDDLILLRQKLASSG